MVRIFRRDGRGRFASGSGTSRAEARRSARMDRKEAKARAKLQRRADLYRDTVKSMRAYNRDTGDKGTPAQQAKEAQQIKDMTRKAAAIEAGLKRTKTK